MAQHNEFNVYTVEINAMGVEKPVVFCVVV